MSQIYKRMTSSGPIPSNIPTNFVTDDGNAIPDSNILDILTNDTTENNDNGIKSEGSTNVVTILLSNRQTGTVSTSDDTLTTILTFPLGATPGIFYVYGNVQGFNSSTPAGGSYAFSGGYRTDGATATELGVELHDEFEDPSLASADIFLTASGNNVILQVQGVVATDINWNAMMEYRRAV